MTNSVSFTEKTAYTTSFWQDDLFYENETDRPEAEENDPGFHEGDWNRAVQHRAASRKKKGVSSEVFAYTVEETKKMLSYFEEKEMWLHYLVFVLSNNTARRNSDIEKFQWKHFFDQRTGEFREFMDGFTEKKTGKFASPPINSAIKNAINLYCQKTGCDPSKNNFENYCLLQLSGNYAGRVITYTAIYKKIKEAAAACGINHNCGTHSGRKTYGNLVAKIFRNDGRVIVALQKFYNHSNTNTTECYIDNHRQAIKKYSDEIGRVWDEYVTGDGEYDEKSGSPFVTMDVNDLRYLLSAAYSAGYKNADISDPSVHLSAVNDIYHMVDRTQI